jgi:hypothetical protein
MAGDGRIPGHSLTDCTLCGGVPPQTSSSPDNMAPSSTTMAVLGDPWRVTQDRTFVPSGVTPLLTSSPWEAGMAQYFTTTAEPGERWIAASLRVSGSTASGAPRPATSSLLANVEQYFIMTAQSGRQWTAVSWRTSTLSGVAPQMTCTPSGDQAIPQHTL